MPTSLKCKIFQGYESAKIQEEINGFLSMNPGATVSYILQSECFNTSQNSGPVSSIMPSNSNKPHYTITIFYK